LHLTPVDIEVKITLTSIIKYYGPLLDLQINSIQSGSLAFHFESKEKNDVSVS